MITQIPIRELLPECARILDFEMRPIHYSALAGMAARCLRPHQAISQGDIAEDLRGKGKGFPGGSHGMIYTGSPHYMVAKCEWFNDSALIAEPVPVEIGFEQCLSSSVEAMLRFDFMQNKFGVSKERRAKMIARGLLIEKNVVSWFARKWPFGVLPADNEGSWDLPCDHDFKLETKNGQVITVDVTGEKRSGGFGRPKGKPTCDVHVCASEKSGRIWIDGFLTQKEYLTDVPSWKIKPIAALICWANCIAVGVDYKEMAKTIRNKVTP
jgi:hypothetical protein